ncbi:hypothetical protein RJ640_002848 [Escallonia rubra]|uniref:Protein FAR1-RELATED SEQUENCE n=1 Tax=Escallonia rubra TaxID=112253 RepID=A0AA88RRZ6_9ASTE|nr:hypothetical protein RJ640_002848 [Escallonia rubra]
MKIIFDRKKRKYHLSDFNGEHNHDLHTPICVHLLRSQRNITESQATKVDLAYDAGLTQKKAFDLFGVKLGGREHVGFLPLDQKNYLLTKLERGMQFGEVRSLLMSFKNQASQDPSFFNAFQLDNEEQITNIFWADGRMRMDYKLFGDIVTFDTTFATNKDHRPLAVFIGFNHCREQVIFGASLLYDETQVSFDWVYNTFLEAHKFKKPITLFTDQDITMGNAVRVVMPEVRHSLYTFHIMQNAIKHLGNLMKDDSCFLVRDVLGVKYIPETYILKRWTRGARDGCALEDEGLDIHRSEGLNINDRYRELWPDAVRLAHKASEFKDGYILYKTRMKKLDKEIEELRMKHYEFMDHGCELNGSDGVDKNSIESLIRNVKGIKKRGGPPKRGGKRHKSWVEKQPRKRKQMMTNSSGCPNNDKENQDPSLHREAGLDDNLLSTLSQGSNRIQSNDERVFGDFNVLSSQLSTCSSGADAHSTTMAILKLVSSKKWEAKLVISLAAFVVNYGEFWLIAQLYATNPLAKAKQSH